MPPTRHDLDHEHAGDDHRAGPGRGFDDHLDPNGMVLADQLTRVAVRTIYAALAGDADLMHRVRINGKYTPEFDVLRRMRVSAEVRAWVAENFWDPGPVRDAVESEVRIALARGKATADTAPQDIFCAEPRLLLPAEGDPGGVGTRTHNPGHRCEPFCSNP